MRIDGVRYRNAMIGLALGDAWGYQVEFTKYETMPKPVQMPGGTWFVSDDTQMTLALERAVHRLEDGNYIEPESFDKIEQAIIEEFIDWADSPENTRAPGATCMGSIARIKAGIEWWDPEGARKSAGCGAVMRELPVIALGDGEWRAMTALQAVITHKDPIAVASALMLGEVARVVADGQTYSMMTFARLVESAMLQRMYPQDEFLAEALEPVTSDVAEYLQLGTVGLLSDSLKSAEKKLQKPILNLGKDICEDVGEGWDSATAVALAIMAVDVYLSGQATAHQVMEWAVTSEGDSDSIGAITGMLIGLSSDRKDFWQSNGIDPKFEAIYEGKIKK